MSCVLKYQERSRHLTRWSSRAHRRRRVGHERDETDTTFTVDDAVDDDDDDGDEALATFSSSKTIHESVDVVRIAPFPAPPVIEEDEASPVDWAPALPPRERCRPTWPTYSRITLLVLKPGQRSKRQCNASCCITRYVTRHISLSVMARRTRRARACERPRTRARSTLLADAARLLQVRCACTKVPRWQRVLTWEAPARS